MGSHDDSTNLEEKAKILALELYNCEEKAKFCREKLQELSQLQNFIKQQERKQDE